MHSTYINQFSSYKPHLFTCLPNILAMSFYTCCQSSGCSLLASFVFFNFPSRFHVINLVITWMGYFTLCLFHFPGSSGFSFPSLSPHQKVSTMQLKHFHFEGIPLQSYLPSNDSKLSGTDLFLVVLKLVSPQLTTFLILESSISFLIFILDVMVLCSLFLGSSPTDNWPAHLPEPRPKCHLLCWARNILTKKTLFNIHQEPFPFLPLLSCYPSLCPVSYVSLQVCSSIN